MTPLYRAALAVIQGYFFMGFPTDGYEHEVEDGDRAGEDVAGLVKHAPEVGQRPRAYTQQISVHLGDM